MKPSPQPNISRHNKYYLSATYGKETLPIWEQTARSFEHRPPTRGERAWNWCTDIGYSLIMGFAGGLIVGLLIWWKA